ncbi:MAG: hypothetical protein ACJA1A_001097 [Saprospiraceae bacterium]|jgi:hypothetical protein
MKNLGLLILLLLPLTAIADIPRVDALEVSYRGKIYYVFATTAYLKFEYGCVFDQISGEYLYEDQAFFSTYFRSTRIEMFKELIVIPHSKLWNVADDHGDDLFSDRNVLISIGKPITVDNSEKLIQLNGRIIGESAGRNSSQKLTMNDEIWINDYPMERIAEEYDVGMCYFEVFAIKGNVTKKKAKTIHKRLKMAYKEDYGSSLGDEKETGIFLDELLQRNILVLEFCSC